MPDARGYVTLDELKRLYEALPDRVHEAAISVLDQLPPAPQIDIWQRDSVLERYDALMREQAAIAARMFTPPVASLLLSAAPSVFDDMVWVPIGDYFGTRIPVSKEMAHRMALNVKSYRSNQRTVTFPVTGDEGAEEITLTYSPGVLGTPVTIQRLNRLASAEVAERVAILPQILADVMVSWDVTSDGEPYPTAVERLAELHADLLAACMEAIFDDVQKQQAGPPTSPPDLSVGTVAGAAVAAEGASPTPIHTEPVAAVPVDAQVTEGG